MPQKIMASPTNIFDFYDTFQYDVINLNPGEYPPTIPVNERNLQDYIQKYGPFPPNTLRYIHLKNRTLVTQHPTASPLIPLQRQVQGPEGFPDLGFKFLDRNDSERLRYTQPIIASGEGYYIRISGEKGSAFYDSYAKSLLPAAFNHLAFPDRFASRKNRIDRLSIFFSEKGAVTNLHYDESGRGSVLCQLTGSKRIQLWSSEVQEDIIKPYEPSHHQYRRSKLNGRSPQLESLLLSEKRDHSLILKPGWCAYFPVRWWHHIESLGDENISTRFTVP